MIMKFKLLLLFSITSVSLSFGQTGKEYLFDKHMKGKVIYTDGTSTESSLNYNMVNEKFSFISQDGTILAIAQPEEIAFIRIGDRVFEHVKNGVMYERIPVGENSCFYVRWHGRPVSKGKTAAYGATTSTTAVSEIKQFDTYSGGHKLKTNQEYTITLENSYFLKAGKSFKKFSSASTLAKLFKGHEEEIRKYAKDENIDFDSVEDIKKAISFCEQLK